MRKFSSGAVRSNAGGKIEYYGFRNPLCELSFGKYMLKHQVQEDGKLRSSSNWWGGWSKDVSLQSLVRHVEDLQAIHAGLTVIKVRNKKKEIETTYYLQPNELPYKSGKDEECEVVSEEECVNAIKFNCNAYLLEHLKNN